MTGTIRVPRWAGPSFCGLALLIWAIGCSGEGGSGATGERVMSFSERLTGPLTITISVPNPLFPLEPVLLGADSVEVSPGATISSGAVVAMGAGGLEVESDAVINDAWSRGTAVIGDRVRVTGILHASQSTLGTGATVSAFDTTPTFDPASTLSWDVVFPTGGVVRDMAVPSGQAATISPGRYGNLEVHGNATLTLTTGTYYLRSLTLHTQSTVDLDQANGPVIIYVSDSVPMMRGAFVSLTTDEPNLLFGYLGQTTFSVEAPFYGAIVAPFASILLHPGGAHRGVFIGRSVDLLDGGQVVYRLPPALIPKMPTPVVDCVIPPTSGIAGQAVFGFNNTLGATMTLPWTQINRLTPIPPGGRTPGPVFEPGLHHSVFQTQFYGEDITWTLGNQSATAILGSSPTCSPAIYLRSGKAGFDPAVSLVETGHSLPGQPDTVFVDIDNPGFSYPVTLRSLFSRSSNHNVDEEVITDTSQFGTTFNHSNFFIFSDGQTTTRGGVSTIGSVSDTLYPWTAQNGDLVAPSVAPFQSHGMRVGYKPLSLSAFEETNDQALNRNSPKIQVALDPHTLLVPVEVVVLFSDNLPLNPAPGQMSPISIYNLRNQLTFWDGDPLAYASNNLSPVPNGPPELISTTRTFPSWPATSKRSDGRARPFDVWAPDSIWSTCGIQFRIVNFIAIPTDDDHVNPPASVCTNAPTTFQQADFPMQRDYNDLILHHPNHIDNAVPGHHMPTIMFAQFCTCDGFQGGFGTSEGGARVLTSDALGCFTLNSGAKRITPSHEMGHILGLIDSYDIPGTCGVGKPAAGVMCASDDTPTPSPGECITARLNAQAFQTFWQ